MPNLPLVPFRKASPLVPIQALAPPGLRDSASNSFSRPLLLINVCIFVICIVVIKVCHLRGPLYRPFSQLPARQRTNEFTRGLDESAIWSIPTRKYSEMDIGVVRDSKCAVCLANFQENDVLHVLRNCNHSFHMSCTGKLLESQSSCPLCRAKVIPLPATPVQGFSLFAVEDEACGTSSPSRGVAGSSEDDSCPLCRAKIIPLPATPVQGFSLFAVEDEACGISSPSRGVAGSSEDEAASSHEESNRQRPDQMAEKRRTELVAARSTSHELELAHMEEADDQGDKLETRELLMPEDEIAAARM